MTLTLETLPEVTPDQVNRDECRDCRTPRHVWNRLHWLYREWSGKCPDCHVQDIRLDFRDKNQED